MADTASSPTSDALDLVGLAPVMAQTEGSPALLIGLVDGPVDAGHPDLAGADLRGLGSPVGACASDTERSGCAHGTFVAGILAARRGSAAPAICPACPLLVRPVFGAGATPSADAVTVAGAIGECVSAGARIVNLSVTGSGLGLPARRALEFALDAAATAGVLVVAAAGNDHAVASSPVTRHPGVLPVVGYAAPGRPLPSSNLSATVGTRGVGAPGAAVVSLAPNGGVAERSGSSFATAFVTGIAALLWSLEPEAGVGELRAALVGDAVRRTVVAPLVDARAALGRLRHLRRSAHTR
jgi:subtilisin family serine protease